MGFRQRFAKKPGQNALRRQFCSVYRRLPVGLCSSASRGSSPGLSAQRAGSGAHDGRTSGEGPPAQRQQGDPQKKPPPEQQPPRKECAGCEPGLSSSTTHRPPWTCVLHTADHLPRCVQGEGCKGHRECWTGVEGAAMPSPKENSCRLVHR